MNSKNDSELKQLTIILNVTINGSSLNEKELTKKNFTEESEWFSVFLFEFNLVVSCGWNPEKFTVVFEF